MSARVPRDEGETHVALKGVRSFAAGCDGRPHVSAVRLALANGSIAAFPSSCPSSAGDSAAPLTEAELDLLDTLNRARTPGTLRHGAVQRDRVFIPYAGAVEGPNGERVLLRMNEHFPEHVADAAAIVAALNALPALLAEVRASRATLRAACHLT